MMETDKDFYARIYATMTSHDLEYNDYAGDQSDTPFYIENFNLIEHNIIALLNTLGEITMSDLAARLSMLPPNLSPIVKNLENRGFIEKKHKNEDKRFVFISLSDKGRELVKKQDRVLTEKLEYVLNASLSYEEQCDFAEIYSRLVKYFKKMNNIKLNAKQENEQLNIKESRK